MFGVSTHDAAGGRSAPGGLGRGSTALVTHSCALMRVARWEPCDRTDFTSGVAHWPLPYKLLLPRLDPDDVDECLLVKPQVESDREPAEPTRRRFHSPRARIRAYVRRPGMRCSYGIEEWGVVRLRVQPPRS